MTLLLGLVCFQDEQIKVLPVTGVSTVFPLEGTLTDSNPK